ncbi:PREDICTED: protein IMPACT-like [Nicrophorus vespilloides]|uniref:Protein IMPACT-like n=1 Tax=Nicrophorus vespilloides TaxID=110193 RepID=A0ABM1MLZ2_NICVS|nr:PREDICTED: protein IMPACT-like [Nicrophorus vespilloides]
MNMNNNALQAEELVTLKSIYGSQWKENDVVENLYSINIAKDVELYITLNSSYPLEGPPSYDLLAPILTKNVKYIINCALDEIYFDNIGGPVLFQSIERIKDIVQKECKYKGKKDKNNNSNGKKKTDNKLKITGKQSNVKYNIIHGETIEDRKSIFQGHVCVVNSEEDVKNVIKLLLQNKKISQAKHNISAYRITKPNGVLLQDCDDDGENLADGRLMHLLQILNVMNVVVIVTRWYGGIHLGKDRFKHINHAARLALQTGGFV